MFEIIKNKYRKIKNYIKYGFDTDEVWELDVSFYKWLYPRLVHLEKVTNGYPNGKTFDEWKKELQDNIFKLKIILEFEGFPWACSDEFITSDDYKELLEKYGENMDKCYLKHRSYMNCLKSFNKWFGENVNNLWW